MAELYTRMFVRAEGSLLDLLSSVADACNGRIVGNGWTIAAGEYEIDVRPNDDSSDDLRRLHPGNFLYFPYTVEVVVDRDRDVTSEYVSFVGFLMDWLHAQGMQVVAACDWESDLPGGGRLG